MRAITAFAAAAPACACHAAATVYLNEDNEHFYGCRPAEEMTADGCRRLVDYYADLSCVRGMMFCVNMQRALYDSDVWERFRDIKGDYPYLTNLRLLSARKVDQFATWLDRARERGMEGWLSMRMNDSHGLKEAAGGVAALNAGWPSEMWRARKDLRRAPYRTERSWEGSYDYGREEVYRHHLALVREIFGKWGDRMDGLELDWMRWGFFFAPGGEVEGRKTLTRFVRDVRRLADEAGAKSGRRIRLSHRVPTRPESCLDFGFDVLSWRREGCIDMLTLSSFGSAADNAIPMALWRGLVGDDVWLNVSLGESAAAHAGFPVGGCSFSPKELLYGNAASAFARGADGVYLFNECYLYSRPEKAGRELLSRYLPVVGDSEALSRTARRMPVTGLEAVLPGQSAAETLPAPLRLARMGVALGRMERNMTFRVDAGKIAPETRFRLALAFDAETDFVSLGVPELRVNTSVVMFAERFRLDGGRIDPNDEWQVFADYPRDAACVLVYDVPSSVLHETFNAVEMVPPQIPGSVVWVELSCQEAR